MVARIDDAFEATAFLAQHQQKSEPASSPAAASMTASRR
jgi:hypothetical protein